MTEPAPLSAEELEAVRYLHEALARNCPSGPRLLATIEAERARAEEAEERLAQARQHAKGIVQGANAKKIAEIILAEHDDNVPRGASREKLDDELCRVCALARMILNSEERVRVLQEALEDLADLQNGPPLVRDTDEWEAVMARVWALLAVETEAGL